MPPALQGGFLIACCQAIGQSSHNMSILLLLFVMAFIPSSNSLVAHHARLSPVLLARRGGLVLARPPSTWRQALTILSAFNDQSSSSPSPSSAASKPLRESVPFEIRGISLPLVVFTLGMLLTGSSFVGKPPTAKFSFLLVLMALMVCVLLLALPNRILHE